MKTSIDRINLQRVAEVNAGGIFLDVLDMLVWNMTHIKIVGNLSLLLLTF